MLSTVLMLFLLACMLGLIFQFRLGAIPLVIVLTSIMALIKLIRRAPFLSIRVGGTDSSRK